MSAYLIVEGTPPPDTAGSWHLPCLSAAAPIAEQWGRALVRSYLDVRRYELIAHTPQWTIVRNARTGEVLALGHHGATLPLDSPTPPGRTDAYRVTEAEYWLEWDEPVILDIQHHLRRAGGMPVLEVADHLGMRHRLSHPELLADSAFMLEESLVAEWIPTVVGVSVDYAVPLPFELAPYLVR